ncbi:Hypothetical predicted protein [Cloeon dipterum]|uniref:Cytochrome c oxidase assembly protein COX15 homolog n=1 Tax=Cloeon dipterum TaxID=197152 RepID=A0A8S1DK06_9INSE|nr:Hypothetical predicted protein [Cloeon dipterum]
MSMWRAACGLQRAVGRMSCPLQRTRPVKLLVGPLARMPVRGAATVAVEGSQKAVGWWLMGCGGMVFGAVVLGGVTRLTESGLSMVTWRLLGEHRPRTQQEWQDEFARYQQFPEFQIKNKDMRLEEFKMIWWMEYLHRQWGRTIGAAFFLPAAFFWATGRLSPGLKRRVVACGGLLGVQGLLGWYMVRSGLEHERFSAPESSEPRVSQYRLAAHLGTAFLLYTLLLWNGLDQLLPAQPMPQGASALAVQQARRLRGMVHGCKAAVLLTAVSGAFVAGLDAGLVYNSFPKMADRWIPSDVLAMSPPLRNLTENPTTVQFQHRVLGTGTLLLVTGAWLLARRRTLPPRAHTAAAAAAAMAWMQVLMGITTLLTLVPVPIAAAHQSGSLMLLSFAIWLSHELKRVPK